MTNLSPSPNKIRQMGAATLIIAVALLVASTLVIIFAANFGIMQEKITTNTQRQNQAFEAAEAGLEFGINYLQTNSATILANPVSGFIPAFSNSNTTNVALANGSHFSLVYTNPTANNYNLIEIRSTGTSDDGTSTRIVSQQVQFGSTLVAPSNTPVITQGQVTMSGNASITNTEHPGTLVSGSTVALSGDANTVLSSGTSSTPGNIKSDIQTNNMPIANMSANDFFATYFGNNTAAVQSNMAHVYTNSGSTNYNNTLNNMTGTSIWINQTAGVAAINGNTTIGSATNPVLLVVNGSLSLSGNVTIYGYVFVMGGGEITTTTGNTNIIGGLATTGNMSMSGNVSVTYSSSTLNNLQNLPTMRYYAKVPGTWRDF
ncbi:MAG: PilX N-terminal domain-containing pilus assembly protein [Gammaproteobacteria bacterium]